MGFPRNEELPWGLAQFLPALWAHCQSPSLLRVSGAGEQKLSMGLEDIVPARVQPSVANPRSWNVCRPISRVFGGSPRVLIILQ